MYELRTTAMGALTSDVDLKEVGERGDQVATFRMVHTSTKWDAKARRSIDNHSSHLWVNVWGEMGVHCAKTLRQGDRVVVVGVLRQRDYEDVKGVKRSGFELMAEDVGLSLKYETIAPEDGEEVDSEYAVVS